MDLRLAVFLVLVGLVAGYFLRLDQETPEAITVTETRTDTVFIEKRDTVFFTKKEIKHEYLRDTVYLPEWFTVKAFTASKPFLYGNTTVRGEVLGEVLKLDVQNDFRLPTVTNTITNTTTVIKKPSGFFLTAGFNLDLRPAVGAVYIKDRYLIGLSTSGFSAGYKIR